MMKHAYKILVALCLMAGTACNQQEKSEESTAGIEETESTATDSVSNEVPAGLEQH